MNISVLVSISQENVESARQESKPVAVLSVDYDEDVAPLEVEVSIQCPLCKVATTEREAVDNLFLLTESDEGFEGQDSQICVSSAAV